MFGIQAADTTGLWDDRGNYDASGNAYPSTGGSGIAGAILKGDIWTISVGGTLPTGQVVIAGDTVRALQDTPGNTQGNWAIAQNFINYTPANINSPTFTGVPAAPTANVGTNTTQLATTAFVIANAPAATTLYSGNSTVGAGRVATLTDSLIFKSLDDIGTKSFQSQNSSGTVRWRLNTSGANQCNLTLHNNLGNDIYLTTDPAQSTSFMSNNVGFGIATAAYQVTVQGNGLLVQNSGGATNGFYVRPSGGTDVSLLMQSNSGANTLNYSTATGLLSIDGAFNIGSTANINKFLTASATLDFPNTLAGLSSDLTITLTGAADGDAVILGVPNVSVLANSDYSAWVSAANTVTVRYNNYSVLGGNPASGTFTVSILK